MHPGNVNTKLLLAGWGYCGIHATDHTNTYALATKSIFDDPGELPKYYNERL